MKTNLKGNVCRNSTFQVNRKKNDTGRRPLTSSNRAAIFVSTSCEERHNKPLAISLANQQKTTKLYFSSQVRKQFKLLAVPFKGTVIIYREGRATIFSKSAWKKIWPSPSTWQKKLWPSPYPFFYFHPIFFNKNNIFYKKMCSLQQLFCIFWKSWKAVFLRSQAKEANHSQPFVLYVFDDIFWPVFSSEGPSWSIES